MQEPHRARRLALVRHRRTRRLARALGLLAALSIIALSGGVGAAPSPALRALFAVWVFVVVFFPLGSLLFCAGELARLARQRFGGRLEAVTTDDALLVHDRGRPRWSVPWSDVGVAWRSAPGQVEVLTAGGDEALVSFQTPQQANAFVTTIRAHARERRAYPVSLMTDGEQIRRELLAWTTPALFVPVAAIGGVIAAPFAVLALVLGWALAQGERRITLGADGLVFEHNARRRYVPYRKVVKVELGRRFLGARSLRLRLADGSVLRLGRRLDATRARLVASLLEEGMKMVEQGEAAGPSSAVLAPDNSTPREWLAKLRAATKENGYRSASLDAERLLSIVRNPAADASQRIAAALTLRAEPRGLARVRVAAEVSTEPEVREALEAIAADTLDEARVVRALERLVHPRR